MCVPYKKTRLLGLPPTPLEVFAVMEIESAFCLACFSIPINYIVPYPSRVYYIAANATDSLHYYHS